MTVGKQSVKEKNTAHKTHTWCKFPTTSSKLGAKALFTYKNTLSVSLHRSFRRKYLTTSSNRLAALILHTSCANTGADPTALNRTIILRSACGPIEAAVCCSASAAERGRSASTTDADIVSGSSEGGAGDEVPLGEADDASGTSSSPGGEAAILFE